MGKKRPGKGSKFLFDEVSSCRSYTGGPPPEGGGGLYKYYFFPFPVIARSTFVTFPKSVSGRSRPSAGPTTRTAKASGGGWRTAASRTWAGVTASRPAR